LCSGHMVMEGPPKLRLMIGLQQASDRLKIQRVEEPLRRLNSALNLHQEEPRRPKLRRKTNFLPVICAKRIAEQ